MTRALRMLCLAATASLASLARADGECAVTAEEWSRPRSAAMVVALPGVRDCVRRWQDDARQRLVLVHRPGEEGGVWAAELRDWLVALGVPSRQLVLRAVGTDPERIVLRVETVVE